MPEKSQEKSYRLRAKFVMTRIGGEAVVAPICDSTADMGKLKALNPTGADILECVQRGMDIEKIVDRLMADYGMGDRGLVEKDVTEFIGQMVAAGYVENA